MAVKSDTTGVTKTETCTTCRRESGVSDGSVHHERHRGFKMGRSPAAEAFPVRVCTCALGEMLIRRIHKFGLSDPVMSNSGSILYKDI